MQPMKLLVISSFLFLGSSGCLRPGKPVVEVCALDIPANESICGLTGQGAGTHTARQPLLYVDKGTAFRPPEWKKVKNYIDMLEAYADDLEKHCK